jgi:hypothetical protein
LPHLLHTVIHQNFTLRGTPSREGNGIQVVWCLLEELEDRSEGRRQSKPHWKGRECMCVTASSCSLCLLMSPLLVANERRAASARCMRLVDATTGYCSRRCLFLRQTLLQQPHLQCCCVL